MARTARNGRKRFLRRDVVDPVAFEHTSHRELADVVRDHLIPDEQHGSTARWHPSRRGNSPHHRD